MPSSQGFETSAAGREGARGRREDEKHKQISGTGGHEGCYRGTTGSSKPVRGDGDEGGKGPKRGKMKLMRGRPETSRLFESGGRGWEVEKA